MAKFRKRPVVIEAIRVGHLIQDARVAWSGLPDWVKVAYEDAQLIFADKYVLIHTLEGSMRGEWNDWLIQGVSGELYPCKDSIFKATYEPVEESEGGVTHARYRKSQDRQ